MSHVPYLLCIFGISVVAGAGAPLLLVVFLQRDQLRELAIILFALAIVGACAGLAGGMSRVGAVGSIIPAFLGLLGGLSIYLFGLDRSKGLVASLGAGAISLALIVSYTGGSQFRNIGDEQRDIRATCAKAYIDQKLLADDQAFTRFRERLGRLCDESMSWEMSDDSIF